MERTNFFKLPIKELEQRIVQINEFMLKHPTHRRKAELYDIMVSATQMLEARNAVKAGGKGTRLLKDALEVFWGDIPLKYDDTKIYGKEKPEASVLSG